MSFSDEPIIPTDPEKPPKGETAAERVRRRRATRRQMIPMDMEGQSELISTLAKRAYPSVELFIFSLLCGAIMGLGFLLDSQAVLLLGILLTPLMTPWVGFLLAILTGNIRFLLQMLMALLVSAFLVFIGGLITGFASRFFEPITWSNVFIHASLWKPVLVVLGFGAVTLVASFVRSEARPYLPSVIIAFGFFLPVNAAGFGLGAGLPGVWPNGLFVFVAHLVIATVLGLITLFVLKIRPTPTGMIASAVIGIISLLILFNLLKPNTSSPDQAATSFTPTNPPTPLRSPTNGSAVTSTSIILPATTSTPNSVNFTETVAVALTQVAQTRSASTSTPTPGTPTPVPLTLAITLPASQTPTVTLTIEIQPISGRVSASEGGGANLRQTPNGKYLMTLDNGAIVEIYPDFKQVNGVTWIHVFATRNGQRVEGWLLESVVSYATPEPNFEPSNTPNP